MPINVSSLSAKQMPLVAFFDRARVLWGETRIYYFAAPFYYHPSAAVPLSDHNVKHAGHPCHATVTIIIPYRIKKIAAIRL